MLDRMVTIVGSAYFEPIARLYADMDDTCSGEPGKVQASHRENGYAASICILSIACLESYAVRAWYLHHPDVEVSRNMRIVTCLPALYDDFPFTAELNELYIQRDALIHNHLWEIGFSWDSDGKLVKRGINKKSTGDGKYQLNVGASGEVTETLKLNVNPIMVNRRDAAQVVLKTWQILQYLEAKDPNQCGVSHLPIKYRDDILTLSDLMEDRCGHFKSMGADLDAQE